MWFFIFYRARQDGAVLLVRLAASPSAHRGALTAFPSFPCRAGSTRGTVTTVPHTRRPWRGRAGRRGDARGRIGPRRREWEQRTEAREASTARRYSEQLRCSDGTPVRQQVTELIWVIVPLPPIRLPCVELPGVILPGGFPKRWRGCTRVYDPRGVPPRYGAAASRRRRHPPLKVLATLTLQMADEAQGYARRPSEYLQRLTILR